MQLLAHSVVPANPLPYMHLGYLSAQSRTLPNSETLFYSAFGFSIITAIATLLLVRRKPVMAVICGILCVGVMLGAVQKIMHGGTLRYLHPAHITRHRIETVLGAAHAAFSAGQPFPPDVTAWLSTGRDKPYDGWFHRFDSYALTGGKECLFVAVSRGKDGAPNTSDDFTGIYAAPSSRLQALGDKFRRTYPQVRLEVPADIVPTNLSPAELKAHRSAPVMIQRNAYDGKPRTEVRFLVELPEK